MNEYNITLKIRNNLLLQAFRNKGEVIGRALAEKIGMRYDSLNGYIALKRSPLNAEGEYRDDVYKICEFLNMMPTKLWTDEQLTPLIKSTVEVTASYDQLNMYLPYANDGLASLEYEETQHIVDEVLNTIQPRYAEILKRRYGIGVKKATLEEIAEEFDITPERVRQVELKTLRLLRSPRRVAKMREQLGLTVPEHLASL